MSKKRTKKEQKRKQAAKRSPYSMKKPKKCGWYWLTIPDRLFHLKSKAHVMVNVFRKNGILWCRAINEREGTLIEIELDIHCESRKNLLWQKIRQPKSCDK